MFRRSDVRGIQDPYSYDRWGDAVASQAGYTAEKYVDGNTIGCGSFNEPADLYISHDNLMYIADKGNNRIVVTDLDFNFKKEMKEFSYKDETLTLAKPTGVYVDQYTGYIYICDTENDRVIKCDKDGKVDRLFEKPTDALYDQALTIIRARFSLTRQATFMLLLSHRQRVL